MHTPARLLSGRSLRETYRAPRDLNAGHHLIDVIFSSYLERFQSGFAVLFQLSADSVSWNTGAVRRWLKFGPAVRFQSILINRHMVINATGYNVLVCNSNITMLQVHLPRPWGKMLHCMSVAVRLQLTAAHRSRMSQMTISNRRERPRHARQI